METQKKPFYLSGPCLKTKFRSKEDAEFTINRIKGKNTRKNSDRKAPIDSYLCNVCNSWHITSKLSFSSLNKKIEELTIDRDSWKKKFEEKAKEINAPQKAIKRQEKKSSRKEEEAHRKEISALIGEIFALKETIKELQGKLNVMKFENKYQKQA